MKVPEIVNFASLTSSLDPVTPIDTLKADRSLGRDRRLSDRILSVLEANYSKLI
jgi:hypothetical protein